RPSPRKCKSVRLSESESVQDYLRVALEAYKRAEKVLNTFRTMVKLSFFFLLLSFYTIVNAGSHSLWAFATYISGETPFPECSVVLMQDDIQVGYFDSNIEQFIHKGHNAPDKTEVDVAQDAAYVFGRMFLSMKRQLSILRYRFNSTGNIDVKQRMTGCEMLDNGEPGLILSTDAFNAIFADLIYYNMTHYS
ncbi:hypothetical protein J4Q44_G00370970, partial [Coregonus suidteri]